MERETTVKKKGGRGWGGRVSARRAELEGEESSHIRHGRRLQGQTQCCGEWPCYRHSFTFAALPPTQRQRKQDWKTTKNRDAQLELLPKL